MNCRQIEAALDDFVDRALPAGERREVERHLDECAACRGAESELRGLLARAANAGLESVPDRDLWPEVADRIAAGSVERGVFGGVRRVHWPSLAPAAAVAVLLITVTSVVTTTIMNRRGTEREASQAGRPQVSRGVSLASLELAQAQATYAQARTQLLAALEVRRRSLSPETRAVVDKNLRIIDQAVSEMQAALAHDPGNPEIPRLLMTAYAQELDLLQRLTELPGRA